MADAPARWARVTPRLRVVSDNDYAGDPDGLVQLAHLLLSPSVEVPLIIGSHLRPDDPMNPDGRSAAGAAAAARRVAGLCGHPATTVVAGSEVALERRDRPVASAAASALVTEAMRDDADLPLFVTCGGGLTEIASAWLSEPQIATRLTVVWIGGREHGDGPTPPGTGDLEYNAAIDLLATQVVFNDSDLHIWQVPRDVYRTATASRAELQSRLATAGELGRHLFDRLADLVERAEPAGLHLGETYILGDNPLVLLTALGSSFHRDPSSSPSEIRRCPRVLDSGAYEDDPGGRPIRVFTALDDRLMLEDLFAKLEARARS